MKLRTGLLWLLIDLRKPDELRRRLQAWHAAAANNRAYWAAYAAGWTSLAEPRLALPWYARELEIKRDDYLWLLNYADTLEQAGQASMAWRVQRSASGEAEPRSRMPRTGRIPCTPRSRPRRKSSSSTCASNCFSRWMICW